MIGVDLIMTVAGLCLMLGASEIMVRNLSHVGERLGLHGGPLGFLVALGADAPEISTALVALISGSQSIGVGVVEGSNIYNLAGLLGLSSLVVGVLLLDGAQVLRAGTANLVITGAVVFLILWSSTSSARILLAVFVLLASGGVFLRYSASDRHEPVPGSILRPAMVGVVASLVLVGTSWLVVHGVEGVVRETAVPVRFFSILVLPVTTSIPNTWAAVSLALKRHGTAVVSTVFNSNMINLSLGVALPSLFVTLRPPRQAVWFDAPYLFGMTAVTIVLLWTASRLSRWEGAAIIGLYAIFLVVRLAVL